MIKYPLPLLFISLCIAGCTPPVREENKPETSAFYEIFPVLVDTFHYDNRRMLYELTNDTLKLDSLARDTTAIVIAIRDTLEHLKDDDYLRLHDHLKALSKEVDSILEDTLRILELSGLKASDKRIKFLPISSFPKGFAFWKTKYSFHLSAKFFFSNILFSKDKTHGLLHVGYVCGPYTCGEGFRVYVKRDGDGWAIEKVEEMWAM